MREFGSWATSVSLATTVRARLVGELHKCTGAERYINIGFLFWHFMGTGKTLSALSVVSNFKQNAIVICPDYLKFVWGEELKKWKIRLKIIWTAI